MLFAIFAVVFFSVQGVLTAPSRRKAAGQRYRAGHKIKLSRRSLHQGPPNMQHNNSKLFRSKEIVSTYMRLNFLSKTHSLLLDGRIEDC